MSKHLFTPARVSAMASRASSRLLAGSSLPTASPCGCSSAAGFASLSKSPSNSSAQNGGLLQQLFTQNKNWQDTSGSQFTDNVDNVLNTQIPQATLLTCCDSRAPSAALGLMQPNKTFEIRNIGNQAMNARGSIEYGTQVLKTPYLLIMGHTGCGAVMGALSDYKSLHSKVQQELLSLVKSVRFGEYVIDGSIESLDEDLSRRANIMSELNVDFQVLQMLDDPKIKKQVEAGEFNIIGLMFDIHNAHGTGHGQLKFININGETDAEKLKKNSFFAGMSEEDKATAITRLFEYPSGFQYASFAE